MMEKMNLLFFFNYFVLNYLLEWLEKIDELCVYKEIGNKNKKNYSDLKNDGKLLWE